MVCLQARSSGTPSCVDCHSVGYQAIAPDLPGYGNSKSFALNNYALPNQATLLHKLMKLGIKSFDLASSSMGGARSEYCMRNGTQTKCIASPLLVRRWALSIGQTVSPQSSSGLTPLFPLPKNNLL